MAGILCMVSWDRVHPLRPWVEKAIKDMCAFDHLRSAVILDEDNICVGSVFSDHSALLNRYSNRVEVIDGMILPNKDDGTHNANAYPGTISQDADGRYNILEWNSADKMLRVYSDILGSKPLYYWTDGSILILSSELKTFRLFPFFIPKIDFRVLAATLTLGFPLDDGTLLEGIKVLPTCHGMIFQSGKTVKFPLDTWKFTSARHRVSEPDLVEELDSVIEASTSKWLSKYPKPLVSLSGGMDSRTALGYCLRLAPDTIAATWGLKGSEDLVCAQKIARRAGCRHLHCNLSVDRVFARDELEQSAWKLECWNAVSLPFYGIPWFQFLVELQRPIVHGYVADSAAGAGLTDYSIPIPELGYAAPTAAKKLWSFAEQSGSVSGLSRFSTPEFLECLSVDLADNLVAAYGQFDSEFVYQRLIQLELYIRSRRYIGHTAAPKLCEAAASVVLPYYCRRYLDFYATIPLSLLLDRKLFRQVLLKAFPKLARVREADHWRPPAAGNRMHYAIDRIKASHKLRWITGRDRRIASDAIFPLLLEKHRLLMAEAIGDVHEQLSGAIDMQGISNRIRNGENRLDRLLLMRLYNVSVFIRRYFGGASRL